MASPNERPIIVIRKVKKISGGHHGGAWKVAYADFVTAMMAFFMLLWLISNPDKARLKGLAEYFTPAAPSALSNTSSLGDSPGDSGGAAGRNRRAQADAPRSKGQPSSDAATAGAARGGTANVPSASLRVMAQDMRVSIDSSQAPDAQHDVRVEQQRDGLRISLMDSDKHSMFVGATAQLNAYARGMLARIAGKLARSGAQIAIEGHTDSTGGQSDANWLLSGQRALVARSALIAAGLTPDRFSEVVAKGPSEPVYPDQPDRPENRRITIIVLGAAPAAPTDAGFKF